MSAPKQPRCEIHKENMKRSPWGWHYCQSCHDAERPSVRVGDLPGKWRERGNELKSFKTALGKLHDLEDSLIPSASKSARPEALCSICDKPANSFTLLCDYCDPSSSVNNPATPEREPKLNLKQKCMAMNAADPPQDCDWPFCGCDPVAAKVVETLQESGLFVGSRDERQP